MIKVDTYGYGASQALHILRYHVHIQFNKNTTASYALQHERDGGMISQGIGRENVQNLEPMGKIQMSKGEPIKVLTTHFVFLCQSLN